MDIDWLKDFEALVAQKNFSRAAEERNVSQPAFSRRIRALEEGVGVTLIDLLHNRVFFVQDSNSNLWSMA